MVVENIGRVSLVSRLSYKTLSNNELEWIFKDTNLGIKIPLMKHQNISIAFASERDRILLLHGVGTGKTLCALGILKLWYCKKILVVCPSSAFGSWRRDLRYNTDFSYQFIIGSGRNRKRMLKKEKEVNVITYAGLKTVYAKLQRKNPKRKGWEIQDDLFIHDFDCIILDEVHKVKNHESLQSRICYELSKRAKYVIGMTGTLIDDSYLELFNIVRTTDLGKSLGTNFFAYRYRYFDKKICGSRWGRKWVEWELKPGCEQEILDKISGVSISFSREECFDLPPLQKIFRFITPSQQFRDIQECIIKNNRLNLPGMANVGNKIKAKAHVLRELPSGFFYYGKDKQVYRLKKNPKVEALLDLLEDSSSKIIVFYQYTEEWNIISKALKKEKIPFCSAFGGQDEDDRESEKDRFQEDEKVRVLVSQDTVASEGYDAFAANVVVFFSPLSSPKMIKQCTGRAYRKGQKRKVLVVTFVMEDSIEERVIVNRSERFNLVRETMDYIKDFHKGREEENV